MSDDDHMDITSTQNEPNVSNNIVYIPTHCSRCASQISHICNLFPNSKRKIFEYVVHVSIGKHGDTNALANILDPMYQQPIYFSSTVTPCMSPNRLIKD